MSERVDAFVKAEAEGYPVLANLDRRPPAPGGMAPEGEKDILRRGLERNMGVGEVMGRVEEIERRFGSVRGLVVM